MLNVKGEAVASSIFSNIFAGLITGFAISLMSGVKSSYTTYLEAKYSWLEETHEMLLEYLNMHNKLRSSLKLPTEEFFDMAYDTGSRANWVNERIMQGTFDKAKWFDPPTYFSKRYGYDCKKMSEVLCSFREDVLLPLDVYDGEREEAIRKFSLIVDVMSRLNHDVLDDMKLIKIKLTGTKKSIL